MKLPRTKSHNVVCRSVWVSFSFSIKTKLYNVSVEFGDEWLNSCFMLVADSKLMYSMILTISSWPKIFHTKNWRDNGYHTVKLSTVLTNTECFFKVVYVELGVTTSVNTTKFYIDFHVQFTKKKLPLKKLKKKFQ